MPASSQPNKGLQIRQNKLNKQAKKRATVKPNQVGLIGFVEYSERIIERINGKYRHPTKTQHGHGLQVENKIYLPNGKYKLVNRSTLKITKRYQNIPEWADTNLLDKYKQIKGNLFHI